MIGIRCAKDVAPELIVDKSTLPYEYPLPPAETVAEVILPPTTFTTTLPPVPSPRISNSASVVLYPEPWSWTYIFLIWFSLIVESPLSLTETICASVVVSQSFGMGIYSIESNLIISLGDTVNKYFQI